MNENGFKKKSYKSFNRLKFYQTCGKLNELTKQQNN